MISHEKIAKNYKSQNVTHHNTSIRTFQLYLVVNHGRHHFPVTQITENRVYKVIPCNTTIILQHNTKQHIAQYYRPAHHSTSHERTAQKIAQTLSTRTLKQKPRHHTAPQHKPTNDSILFHTAGLQTSDSSRQHDKSCSMISSGTTSNTSQHYNIRHGKNLK